MSFRDQLVSSILSSLRPSVERAVNEALGVGSPAPAPVKASRAPRAVTTAARAPRASKPAKGKAESYSAADPNARRLPNFVRELLGKELPKAQILAKYGAFTFTPRTITQDMERAAAAIADNKANPPAGETATLALAPKKDAARLVRARGPILRKKAAKS